MANWQSYQIHHLHKWLNCVIPLSCHIENVDSESDGRNKWLLFIGLEEDAAINLKGRLN